MERLEKIIFFGENEIKLDRFWGKIDCFEDFIGFNEKGTEGNSIKTWFFGEKSTPQVFCANFLLEFMPKNVFLTEFIVKSRKKSKKP